MYNGLKNEVNMNNNIVTVVCDLNKVGLKALIYCHHGVKWGGTLGSF